MTSVLHHSSWSVRLRRPAHRVAFEFEFSLIQIGARPSLRGGHFGRLLGYAAPAARWSPGPGAGPWDSGPSGLLGRSGKCQS